MKGKKGKISHKVYFEVDAEHCYPLEWFEDRIDDGESEIILQLGKYCRGGEFHWCKIEGELIQQGGYDCGKKNCTDYKPRNGKNGCCIHLINCYEPSGKTLILTKDGLKELT
jgi:hypothetical protein